MMVAMVGGLVLAWLPMNLINMWRDFSPPERFPEWYSVAFAACHVTAMTSAVWNFVIYSWFNPQFKETLLLAWNGSSKNRTAYSAMNTTKKACLKSPSNDTKIEAPDF